MTKKSKSPMGRPKHLIEAKRHVVIMDSETVAKAKEIGNGNVSLGVRMAVKDYVLIWRGVVA